MQEILITLCFIFSCYCCYLIGKLKKEKEDFIDKANTIDKGSTAGNAAVNSFRMHSKK